MSKSFIVSGFLFHPQTEQILLYQPETKQTSPQQWTMFTDEDTGSDPLKSFAKVLKKILISPPAVKDIYSVYDYYHTTSKRIHYIYYAVVDKPNNYSPRRGNLGWFILKQIPKLPLSDQAKHDLIISSRVINAQARQITL